ncbi:hypothetical protein FRC14_006216 [Serendipita sp. 396]|nr:hypothetical protein FRC14_006216 [Serendipita sp. 396]KAG8789578.1 hypothetical protein FRC15_006310 [Serendipita sp. 397]KAG8804378.1 hypothetical protein FRC16_008900 [Serendipita sp. 398]KAG8813341.1 hypothetical protein FRC18_002546 [Serendipita sp. 400]KAG8847560.1 hypothetical protein FRB91_011677 [Serendipita sp. 411]KAG8878056.1 hypothetical protein FRC20_009341 [Serendipita sp. 405]
MQRIAFQKDQECAYANARMAAIATALQGKYGLIRTQDSLALIQILTADCLLNPGAKRLTAFDIQLSAVVYSPMARPGAFSVSHTYRNFVAYDLVALFSSPSTFPAGTSQSIITPPAHWISALKTLEKRAAEPGRGGYEALVSIFADDTAINALVRSSVAMTPVPSSPVQFACSPRMSSFALMHNAVDRRISAH